MATPDKKAREFSKSIETKERRMLKEKSRTKHPILKNLGMFGLIGWTVAAPTLLGTFAGNWLDERYPSQRSWTLTLLIAGLVLGCLGAWFWLSKEKKDIQKEEEELND